MSEKPGPEWVGKPLGTAEVDPRGIVEIVVEFDEGEEVLTPKSSERFGSYDLNEVARYIYFLSNHIVKRGYWMGRRRRAGRSQGVEVKRRATTGPGDPTAGELLIRRICLRYEDGRRMCFISEVG